MARKKKNRIFEEYAADVSAEDTAAQSMQDDVQDNTQVEAASIMADEPKESIAEDVPDDPAQEDVPDDPVQLLSQISQLNAELNAAKSAIADLEAQIKKLQSDNDMLVMKLAENAAAQARIPQNTQAFSGQTQMPTQGRKPISTHVQYKHPNYGNNGYGTWH